MAYDAFISYSHAVDGRLAPAVQRGLEHLAKPWHKLRALRVFRDETGLSTNPHLWPSIERALDESTWFIVLASPASAASEWVNREIEHWLATKSVDRVLCVVTDGEWQWDAARGAFDAEHRSAAPPALADAFHDEPRHLDLRWAREETDLDLRNSRFRAAVADLAAPMHGVPKDELESEDIRQHRRTRRLARGAIAALATLLALALASAVFAFTQRDQARERARVANAERLAALSNTVVDTQLDQALLLALEAERLDSSVATRRALLGALTAAPTLVRVDHRIGSDARAFDLSADGTTLVVGRDHGLVQVWDLRTRRLRWARRAGKDRPVTAVALSRDGRTVASVTEHGRIRLWDGDRGVASPVRVQAPREFVTHLVFTGDGAVLGSASYYDGTVRLTSTETGRALRELDTPSVFDLTAAATGAQIAFVDDFGVHIVGLTPDDDRQLPIDPSDQRNARTLAFGSDSALVVGDASGGLTVWDASTLAVRVPRHEAHPRAVAAVTFSSDGTTYASTANGDGVRLWDASTGASTGEPLFGHPGLLRRLWVPSRNRVVTASVGAVASWNLERVALARRVRGGGASRRWGVFATSGRVFALSQGPDGDFEVVDVGRGAVRRVTSRVDLWGYDIDAERGLIAAAVSHVTKGEGASGRVVVRRLADDRVVRAIDLDRLFEFPAPFASSVDLSPAGDAVLIGTTNNRVLRVDLRTGRASTPQQIFEGASNADERIVARYHPGGRRYVVTGTSAGRVYLRGARTDRRIARSPLLGDFVVRGLAFDADRSELAVVVGGNVVRLDAVTLRPTRDPLVSAGGLTGEVAHSTDGSLVAAPTVDGEVIVWDAASGDELATLPVSSSGGVGAGFLPGHRLITAGAEGVHELDLDVAALRRQACAIAGRNLTRREWEHFRVGGDHHATCPRVSARRGNR